MIRDTVWSRCAALIVVLGLFSTILLSDAAFAESPKKLAVVLAASTPGEPPRIVGYFVYLKDSAKVREEIDKIGGWGWNFTGDYVIEVKVKKVSGEGSYQLFVMEGDGPVFESAAVSSDKEIEYRRK